MIRKMEGKDIDEVMELWLIGNMQAHSFIRKRYWEDNYEEIRRVLLLSTVYVWEEDGHICGFIDAMEGYVTGHFVRPEYCGKGIGKKLLDEMKMDYDMLTLNVYQQNVNAVRFYMREGFKIQSERKEETTGAAEFNFVWEG